MADLVSVVIPTIGRASLATTIRSLNRQSHTPSEIIITYDSGAGANWARNEGADKATCPYLLFSDDDITWEKGAIKDLLRALWSRPSAAYAYGWYEKEGNQYCNRPFSARDLKQGNYISTMSLFRRDLFPGFDEQIQRLQDWDLYLTLLEEGYEGVYCGGKIFVTKENDGITRNSIPWEEADEIVRRKHGL